MRTDRLEYYKHRLEYLFQRDSELISKSHVGTWNDLLQSESERVCQEISTIRTLDSELEEFYQKLLNRIG